MTLVNSLKNKLKNREPIRKHRNTEANHVILLLDRSPSMVPLERQARELANEWIGTVKTEARNTEGVDNFLTVVAFSGYPRFGNSGNDRSLDYKTVRNAAYPESVDTIGLHDYQANGNGTAIRDTITKALADNDDLSGRYETLSTMIIVVTDGEDNQSNVSAGSLRSLLALESANTSVAILVPQGYAKQAHNLLGIPIGNVSEWEQSVEGIKEASRRVSAGTTQYYGERRAGKLSTKSFFVDPTSIQSYDVYAKLEPVGHEYVKLSVPKLLPQTIIEISDFVNNRINNNIRTKRQIGSSYQVGRAFYQLTKRETLRPSREILIRHNRGGQIYAGQQARNIIGIPVKQKFDVKVEPVYNMGSNSYTVFVQSTSTNRHLVPGTDLLYKKNS